MMTPSLTPETDRNVFSDKRTIKYTWTSEPHEGSSLGNDEGVAYNRVELTVSHHKSSRCYGVTATRWKVYADGTSTSMPFSGDLVHVARKPCTRYSRKDLGAFAESALAAVLAAPAEMFGSVYETWTEVAR